MPVEPGVHLDELREVLRRVHRRVRQAVDADDLGRHALAHLRLMAGLGEDDQPRVAVQVDEAGTDHQAGGVDAPPRGGLVGRATQHLDPIAPDADRRRKRGVAAPVDHRSADDEQIEPLSQRRPPDQAWSSTTLPSGSVT